MSLPNINVATSNVTSVINESLKFGRRTMNSIPTHQTIHVDNIAAEKSIVSKKQVGLELKNTKIPLFIQARQEHSEIPTIVT